MHAVILAQYFYDPLIEKSINGSISEKELDRLLGAKAAFVGEDSSFEDEGVLYINVNELLDFISSAAKNSPSSKEDRFKAQRLAADQYF